MNITSSDILSLTSEPAVVAQAGKVLFVNPAACGIIGDNCIGKSVAAVFGADVAGAQASFFIADATVCGRQCTVRASSMDKLQYFLFSCRDTSPVIINEAFICFLRTSLMGINASADLGRSRAETLNDKSLLGCFTSLMHSYHRLSRVLQNASFIFESQNGSMFFSPLETDLSLLLRETLDAVEHFRGDIDYRVSVGEGIRLPVDAELFRQLLLNLLSNCFIHASGLSKISVSLIDNTDGVVLSVSDNGCGISKDALANVFDRYRHGFDIHSMNGGIGLGLSVVRGIAELHGGTLLIESREDFGTTVRISFSRIVKNPMRLHSPQEEYASGPRPILTGLADCLSEACFGEKYSD